MAEDVYIVLENGNSLHYFNQEYFYRFINRIPNDDAEDEENEDEDDLPEFIFLEKFPLPNDDATLEDSTAPSDSNGVTMGNYCPSRCWPGDQYLYVMKNGVGGFQPSKKIVQKTVTAVEFCEPPTKPARTRTRTPAQKQARRRR